MSSGFETTAFHVPDAIEPLVGWRYWRLHPEGRLASLTGDHQEWVPGHATVARCRFARCNPAEFRYQIISGFRADRHPAPDEGCTCGIYAARDLRRLRGQLLFGLERMVLGEVKLWGRVVRGEHGFRAERAYPKHLFVTDRAARGLPAGVEGLASYGVPVEVISAKRAGFSMWAAFSMGLGGLGAALRREDAETAG